MIGPSTLYYLHTEKTDGALENASAASYIAINLKVPVKFQKAGTDFTIRPHLDLPWEWGGGMKKSAGCLYGEEVKKVILNWGGWGQIWPRFFVIENESILALNINFMILLLINTTKALSVLQKVEGKVKFRLKSRKLLIEFHLNVQDWRIKLISRNQCE